MLFPSYRQILFQWFLCVSHRFAYFHQYDEDVLLHLNNLAKYVDEFVSYDFYFVYTLKEMDILYIDLDLKHIDRYPCAWLFDKLTLIVLRANIAIVIFIVNIIMLSEKILFWYADVYKA